ncbi:MAG: VgrG-related protein [Prochloraceae cyanobacterium]|nr:VgrG-related protein [Prochloraceae cyanobacterium]
MSNLDGKKYKPPKIEIEIEKQKVSDEFIEDILHISVEESLHLPSMCNLILNNDYFPGRTKEDKPWKHDDLLKIGHTIKIKFRSSTTANFKDKGIGTIFEGEITAVESNFTDESQAPIIVRGYDVSHRLHRGRYNRSFLNMTDSDIVKKVIGEIGISAGNIESSGSPHEYVFQENKTNMEFLRERACRIGFELFIKDNKLNFQKPKKGGDLSLKWLKDFNSFRARTKSSEQISSVEVRGWDYQEKKPIVATAQSEKVITKNQNGSGREVSTKFQLDRKPPKMIVVDRPVSSEREAKEMAQAICDELGGEYVSADAKAEGNPEIRAGKVINLTDMGQYDGEYYVTETRHLYHKRVYTTEFTVRGLRGGNLFSLLSPKTHLKPSQTLMVGVVTDNNDPKGLGRVKVKFPTLTDEHSSNWARVVALGASSCRGFDCLPEINDEVLVGFEHGDIHRPYIVGGVWNGKDKPPEDVKDAIADNKVRLRTIKTPTGHNLQFIEEDKRSSKAGIRINKF